MQSDLCQSADFFLSRACCVPRLLLSTEQWVDLEYFTCYERHAVTDCLQRGQKTEITNTVQFGRWNFCLKTTIVSVTDCIQCHWWHIISSEKSVANVTGTHMCALCTFNIQSDAKCFTQNEIQGNENHSISFCFTLFLSVWLCGWNCFAWENVLSEKPGTECKSCACMCAWERIDEEREWVLVNSSHVSLFTAVLLVSLVRFSRRCCVAVNV